MWTGMPNTSSATSASGTAYGMGRRRGCKLLSFHGQETYPQVKLQQRSLTVSAGKTHVSLYSLLSSTNIAWFTALHVELEQNQSNFNHVSHFWFTLAHFTFLFLLSIFYVEINYTILVGREGENSFETTLISIFQFQVLFCNSTPSRKNTSTMVSNLFHNLIRSSIERQHTQSIF